MKYTIPMGVLLLNLLVFAVASYALAGCTGPIGIGAKPTTSALPSSTPAPTSAPTATMEPKPTDRPPTATPAPTLSNEESREQVRELLQTNGGCDLPCFWGLRPGSARVDEAIGLFAELGSGGGTFPGPRGDFYDTGYELDTELGINPRFPFRGDLIDGIFVSIAGKSFPSIIDENSFYSLGAILERYGTPTDVGLGLSTQGEIGYPDFTGFDLYLFYDELGSIVQYSGTAARIGQYYRVCPARPAGGGLEGREGPSAVVLHLQAADSANPVEQLREAVGGVRVAPRTDIERAFGLNPYQFADLFSTGTGPCLETPVSIW